MDEPTDKSGPVDYDAMMIAKVEEGSKAGEPGHNKPVYDWPRHTKKRTFVRALEGTALIEHARGRFLVREFNDLHLNRPKGLWTWVADAYAGFLLLLAVTGMFVLKGKKGFAGRGKWFVLAGLILPVAFLILFRYV